MGHRALRLGSEAISGLVGRDSALAEPYLRKERP